MDPEERTEWLLIQKLLSILKLFGTPSGTELFDWMTQSDASTATIKRRVYSELLILQKRWIFNSSCGLNSVGRWRNTVTVQSLESLDRSFPPANTFTLYPTRHRHHWNSLWCHWKFPEVISSSVNPWQWQQFKDRQWSFNNSCTIARSR